MPLDREYAICPYCGNRAGDCQEWLTSDSPDRHKCDECGKEYFAWAEYDVVYVTKPIVKETLDVMKNILGAK